MTPFEICLQPFGFINFVQTEAESFARPARLKPVEGISNPLYVVSIMLWGWLNSLPILSGGSCTGVITRGISRSALLPTTLHYSSSSQMSATSV
ncbi:Uncharacterised protein [Yersinia pseudotuberculosis]|uniref:Uncharacterized protein n=1 Tax=Yersinia pseudotuberculosis TaxID=633 RepID=A0A380Q3E9_YERPU|nr:Uncharacterised protein [Yersinia pseudotuberculosis]